MLQVEDRQRRHERVDGDVAEIARLEAERVADPAERPRLGLAPELRGEEAADLVPLERAHEAQAVLGRVGVAVRPPHEAVRCDRVDVEEEQAKKHEEVARVLGPGDVEGGDDGDGLHVAQQDVEELALGQHEAVEKDPDGDGDEHERDREREARAEGRRALELEGAAEEEVLVRPHLRARAALVGLEALELALAPAVVVALLHDRGVRRVRPVVLLVVGRVGVAAADGALGAGRARDARPPPIIVEGRRVRPRRRAVEAGLAEALVHGGPVADDEAPLGHALRVRGAREARRRRERRLVGVLVAGLAEQAVVRERARRAGRAGVALDAREARRAGLAGRAVPRRPDVAGRRPREDDEAARRRVREGRCCPDDVDVVVAPGRREREGDVVGRVGGVEVVDGEERGRDGLDLLRRAALRRQQPGRRGGHQQHRPHHARAADSNIAHIYLRDAARSFVRFSITFSIKKLNNAVLFATAKGVVTLT